MTTTEANSCSDKRCWHLCTCIDTTVNRVKASMRSDSLLRRIPSRYTVKNASVLVQRSGRRREANAGVDIVRSRGEDRKDSFEESLHIFLFVFGLFAQFDSDRGVYVLGNIVRPGKPNIGHYRLTYVKNIVSGHHDVTTCTHQTGFSERYMTHITLYIIMVGKLLYYGTCICIW